jgi:hypothetical protein
MRQVWFSGFLGVAVFALTAGAGHSPTALAFDLADLAKLESTSECLKCDLQGVELVGGDFVRQPILRGPICGTQT